MRAIIRVCTVLACLFFTSGSGFVLSAPDSKKLMEGSSFSVFGKSLNQAFADVLTSCDVVGAIAPHHNVAAALNNQLYEHLRSIMPHPERIILIGPDHFLQAKQNIVYCSLPWKTDYGVLRPDTEGINILKNAARRQDKIFRDHSITEHIPFICRYFGDVPVLPVMIRNTATDFQILKVRRAMESLLKDGGLVILSMDFSHYKPRMESDAEDARSIDVLSNFRVGEIDSLDVDTRKGARLFITLMKSLGITESRLMGRSNSADYLSGSSNRTTGHATLLFTSERSK